MRKIKASMAAAAAAAFIGSSLVTAAPVAAQTANVSPKGELVVVTTNVQEAWQRADLRSQAELDNYVERLLDQVPYVPDVVLLQEVRRKSAAYIRDLLTDQTGDTYRWPLRPPRRPWTQNPKKRTETDNAILFNSETVRKRRGSTGYISLTYERRHAADKEERVEITRHARAAFVERAGGTRLATASVHLQYGHLIDRYVDRYQVRWTNKLARVMKNKFPNDVRTIGGDFNKDRCAERTGARTCRKSPFWQNLTTDPWGYDDVLFEVFLAGGKGVGLGGVDFIFSTGASHDAGSDITYNKDDSNEFYSDHRFFWGVIGP